MNSDIQRWFLEEVQPHERELRAYLRRRFPSLGDTDDLVQESYIRLLRARIKGQIANTRSYLFATARHAAFDFFRRRQILAFEPLTEDTATGSKRTITSSITGVTPDMLRRQTAELGAGDCFSWFSFPGGHSYPPVVRRLSLAWFDRWLGHEPRAPWGGTSDLS